MCNGVYMYYHNKNRNLTSDSREFLQVKFESFSACMAIESTLHHACVSIQSPIKFE